MRQIVILSGKGGAGKTSITASLIKMINHVVAVDADVNASNLPILLPHTRLQASPYHGMDIAQIDSKNCTNCGHCVAACRFTAIVQPEQAIPIIDSDCEGCALCTIICPVKAISMVKRRSGDWYTSQLKNGFLVHADLIPGEDNSGKLISRIRREAATVANNNEIPYIITDGPPGTSCQAISSLTGNDLVLAVVEESLSGLSDYRRLAELIGKFSIPHLVLINKAGFNKELNQKIIQTITEFGGTLVGEIAYDPEIPRALQELKTLADLDKYRDLFTSIVDKILEDP